MARQIVVLSAMEAEIRLCRSVLRLDSAQRNGNRTKA
jgi:hypothetical protein